MAVSKKERSSCPVDAFLTVIDGRWKGLILSELREGPIRTSELRQRIPGITERMLIRHLQELVGDGILVRETKGPALRVARYSISDYGRTLGPIMAMICQWGHGHIERRESSSPSYSPEQT